MAELGDITNLLGEGSGAGPSDYSWLNVDEQQYRALDTLPKQNLDILPDLEAQWSHEGKPPSVYFVPNRDMAGYPVDPRVPQAPATMGDLSQVHGPLQPESSVFERAARLSLMQQSDLTSWFRALSSRYSKDTLRAHKTALGSVIPEFGLLGRFYVDAEDFPKCASSGTKESATFVRRFASEAKFVKMKEACGNCTQKVQVGNAQHCGVFHKQLVLDVPYTEGLAAQVEQEQAARGVQASVREGSAKDRIRSAYLGASTTKKAFTGQENTAALIPVDRLFQKRAVVDQEAIYQTQARPVVALIRRELLKGRTATEVAKALRLAFDVTDLKATQAYWMPLYKEAGLYGAVYSTQDSFDECRVGADFLSRHSSKVRGIVAGTKCGSCIYNQVNRCMMYGRKLIAKAEDLYTSETVAAVLDEYKVSGKISSVAAAQPWGATPQEALQNIHRASSGEAPLEVSHRLDIQQGYYGVSASQKSSDLTKRNILKQASKLMNEGLYGHDLEISLKSQFDPRDLVAAAQELKVVLAEQGLQGIYFVDPTVYDDYGHGCKEAQRLHRSRQAVKYAKVGSKCGTCVHHTKPGHCSVLSKELVREPPYQNKLAQQKAILATGNATETDYDSLVNNGLTMMQEYELKYGSGDIDLYAAEPPVEASIQFGINDVDLTKL